MMMPNERTRALLDGRRLLIERSEGAVDPKSGVLALRASGILRHFPEVCDIEISARALPLIWGDPGQNFQV
jgi:hypothetical protein